MTPSLAAPARGSVWATRPGCGAVHTVCLLALGLQRRIPVISIVSRLERFFGLSPSTSLVFKIQAAITWEFFGPRLVLTTPLPPTFSL